MRGRMPQLIGQFLFCWMIPIIDLQYFLNPYTLLLCSDIVTMWHVSHLFYVHEQQVENWKREDQYQVLMSVSW
jgi:hypothetical protein